MTRILLIGAGKMGSAMLQRWSQGPGKSIRVVEPNANLRDRAAALGVEVFESLEAVPADANASVIVVATKPGIAREVAQRSARLLDDDGFLLSTAAGVVLTDLTSSKRYSCPLIRCMPNTPAMIGEGMTVCCANEAATPAHRAFAKALLSDLGAVFFIEDETLMDAVTAVSGSGPAYVFHFIKSLQSAGISAGLPSDLSLGLAKQTVFGAAKLAMVTDDDLASLIAEVTSPNGTTAAAMAIFNEATGTFSHIIDQAVQAAQARSRLL